MPAKKGSQRSGAQRSKSTVTPAQRRRQREAAAAATTSGRPTAGAARRGQTATLPDTPRWTRDRILGWGAGIGALLALASLTAPALALFFGLLYSAVAFLRPTDRKQAQLTVSTAAIGLWVLLSTVVLAILLATTTGDGDDEQARDIVTGGYLAVSLASGIMISLAIALAAIAFYSKGTRRYRLFSWSGVSLAVYYILFLPSAVGEASTPSTLGSFWAEPISFGRIFLGIIAASTMAAAFWWHGGARPDGEVGGRAGVRFTLGQREYLLAIAAVLLLISRLTDFVFVDWGSLRPAEDQTTSQAAIQALVFLAIMLRLPVLFGAAALAFWTSARQAGWSPTHLLATATLRDKSLDSGTPDSTAPAGYAPDKAAPPPRVPELLLSWRLPLVLIWLVVFVIAASFLGWYGFVVAVPAAAHYLWMLSRKNDGLTDAE